MTESNCSETLMVGDLTEKAFGILANGKMFNILSSKIYTDKIAAPLRELACNAYDAHVAAGKKNVPFDVFIPTYDNPTFYIEDFGVGMDAQEIEELYSTYGASTKTDSNKFVGCLGLGSKSPFAYTDNFTVVSRKNTIEGLIKTKGVLRLDASGRLYIETEDFGVMDIVAFIDELGLRDVEVELKIQAKEETTDEVDPLSV